MEAENRVEEKMNLHQPAGDASPASSGFSSTFEPGDFVITDDLDRAEIVQETKPFTRSRIGYSEARYFIRLVSGETGYRGASELMLAAGLKS